MVTRSSWVALSTTIPSLASSSTVSFNFRILLLCSFKCTHSHRGPAFVLAWTSSDPLCGCGLKWSLWERPPFSWREGFSMSFCAADMLDNTAAALILQQEVFRTPHVELLGLVAAFCQYGLSHWTLQTSKGCINTLYACSYTVFKQLFIHDNMNAGTCRLIIILCIECTINSII